MEKNIIDTIDKIKNIKDIKNIFWKMFYDNKPLGYNNNGKKIKILILNSPCFGFGDIVFCIKISNFLKEWYNADITIATTDPKSFKKLGADNVIDLNSKNKDTQCRRFRLLSPSKTIKQPILASAIIFKASKILAVLETVISFLFLLSNKSLIIGIDIYLNY